MLLLRVQLLLLGLYLCPIYSHSQVATDSIYYCWMESHGQWRLAESPPPPPPIPPPPPEPECDSECPPVVDVMPMYPACMEIENSKERKQCSDKALLEFVYNNLEYPGIAYENGVEGTTVVQFIVGKDGRIYDHKVVRDIGAQCGAEALRVTQLLPDFIPGSRRGEPVEVQYNLPVKFKIEGFKGKIHEPPPPVPPREMPEYIPVVYTMPAHPYCQVLSDEILRRECTSKRINQFITNHLRYSETTAEQDLKGETTIRFTVQKDGRLTDFVIHRSFDDAHDAEALRIVKLLPSFLAGKINGEVVGMKMDVRVGF